MFAYTVFTKGQQKLYKLYPSCSSLFPSTKLFKFFRHGILSTSKYDLQKTFNGRPRDIGGNLLETLGGMQVGPTSISSSDKSLESRRISNDNLECKWPPQFLSPSTMIHIVRGQLLQIFVEILKKSASSLIDTVVVYYLEPATFGRQLKSSLFPRRVKSQPRRTGNITRRTRTIEWM